jgi:anti-anti-sigma factor
VVLEGELDLYSSERVRSVVERECAARPGRLVLDLTHVSFLDSTALHVLLSARRLLRDWRGLVVVARTRAVRRTLDVSGVSRVVTVDDGFGVDD